ncbi:recombinase family protein [Brevibacillus laterosporus]|uniref:recombinase family protein n=1 Tax=Brevibacillus laterosporus TaxID=1465 RepID=UPI000839BAD0|nr:recombinase family protein [Brevibacillus laterosporus]
MIYGYARVSAQDQNLSTQLQQLEAYGVDRIIQEKVSGVQKENPQLDELINALQAGDTIVVTRMDRLGRNTLQLLELVEELSQKGIDLVIMDLNIDTRTHTGKFFLTVMAGFSEMERSIIKEKQRNGVLIAKQQGKYKGRMKKYTEKHSGMSHAIQLYEEGKHTVKQICEITKIGRSSLYRELTARGLN